MQFNYKDVLDLGFVREDYADSVHFSQYGWNPFWMTIHLSKKISLSWCNETHEITMLRCNEKHDVLGRMKIESEQQLYDILSFYGKISKPKQNSE
jgi:hypothetical protein